MTAQRIIVVGLVWNEDDELLLCRMAHERGVFPGEWGLPGGGVHAEERIEEALRRELREELGIEVELVKAAFFKDAVHPKLFPDGHAEQIYMIFLLFHCLAIDTDIHLNAEFSEYGWFSEECARLLPVNAETKDTLDRLVRWGWSGQFDSGDCVDPSVRI